MATQVPRLQVWQVVHVPQEMVPPHPSDPVPQVWPPEQVVAGVHPQMLGVPPPPQVWGDLQLPQLSDPPQPLEIVPQVAPCAAQVVGVQQLPLLHAWPEAQQLLPHATVEAAQTHFPFVHVWFGPQAAPQAPQFWESELVLTQLPPQQVPLPPELSLQLAPEPGWQIPLVQVWQVEQLPQLRVPPQPSGALPQVTPSCAQVDGVQQVPLLQTWPAEQQALPHVIVGGGQVHRPFVQVWLAPQAVPQEPQLLGSELVVTQVPEQQVVPVGHLWLQLPQLLLLVWRLTQLLEQPTVPAGQGQKPVVQVPVQHVLDALQAPPAATHFAAGAVTELPDVVVDVGSGVDASAAPAREGNMADATPAARIFKALRRDRGVASCLASSSKRLSSVLLTRPS